MILARQRWRRRTQRGDGERGPGSNTWGVVKWRYIGISIGIGISNDNGNGMSMWYRLKQQTELNHCKLSACVSFSSTVTTAIFDKSF